MHSLTSHIASWRCSDFSNNSFWTQPPSILFSFMGIILQCNKAKSTLTPASKLYCLNTQVYRAITPPRSLLFKDACSEQTINKMWATKERPDRKKKGTK